MMNQFFSVVCSQVQLGSISDYALVCR